MVQGSKFFIRRLWSNLYLLNGLVFLMIGGRSLTSAAGWRIVLGLPLFAFGAWTLYVAWLAKQRPIIAINDEAIEIRTEFTRAQTRVPRAEVLGVAWSNPGALDLRLNSGDTVSVNLMELTPADKAAIHELLSTGRTGA